ncbi:MAG: methyltransferase [Erythrobacter sp.]
MPESFLDRVYKASGNAEMRGIYDDWASEYDAEVAINGYQTPLRVAAILKDHLSDQTAPILDFGCGTGLSGEALKAAGFTQIDGSDLSEGMLDIARSKSVYRSLHLTNPEMPLAEQLGDYSAITAVGVISKGAAPASIYGELIEVMKPGAILAFSMNDLSLNTDEYGGLVKASLQAGTMTLITQDHGAHLAKYGQNSGSMIYILKKRT